MNRQDFVDFVYYIEATASKNEETPFSVYIEQLNKMPADKKNWINLIVTTKSLAKTLNSEIVAILQTGVILADYTQLDDNTWGIALQSEQFVPFDEIVLLQYEY